MKDKEKQIEEMQKTLCTTDCQECMSEYLDFLKEHNLCGDSTTEMKKRCIFHEHAEKLYNLGYRKITDSVVLTKEELEEKYEPGEKFMAVARELEDLKQNLEDKVLLSREEYERLKGERKLCDNCGTYFQSAWTVCPKCGTKPSDYKRGSKETAEKFANFVKSKLFDLGNIVNERDVDDMLKGFWNEN